MGIELPPELAGIAAATGLSWPQADEDALRAQAGAWRSAAQRLGALGTDADGTAGGALAAMSGPAGDAARSHWSGFADPDHGHLSVSAREAGQAADRLDHAAEQVGTAKVELVRQLTAAARNSEAAHAAATGGHPAALLGLDTALRGTATNLTSITDGLAGAVGPQGGPAVHTLGQVVNPNPGTHGPASLLSTVDGQGGPAGLLGQVRGAAENLTGGGPGQAPGDGPLGHARDTVTGLTGGGSGTGLLGHAEGAVTDLTGGTGQPGLLGHAEGAVTDLTGTVGDPGHAVGAVLGDTGAAVHEVTDGATGAVDAVDAAPGHGPGVVDQVTGAGADLLGGVPAPPPADLPVDGPDAATGALPALGSPAGSDAGTGPIQVTAQEPAREPYQGLLDRGGFPEAPTPPSGVPVHAAGHTTLAGYAGAPAAAPVPPPAAQPAPFAGGPAFAPPAPVYPQPGPLPGYPPPVPGVGAPLPPGPARGPDPAPRWAAQPAAAPPYPQPYQPQPVRGADPGAPGASPHAPAAPPVAKPERTAGAAAFLVYMFPFGHLPVAADRPARQLPAPAPELDYAAGLRFPPHDHPRSDLIDPAALLDTLAGGGPVATDRSPAPPPDALTEDYLALGELSERDWNRRYLAGMRGEVPEYAWPPGELYPEGGEAQGEPVLVFPGDLLDRFGSPAGRVFAATGTSFGGRSLPPSHLDGGYRRYRVLRELPMWRARCAGWFAQPGGGERYRAVYPATELVALGYLADITPEADSTPEPGDTQEES